MNHFEMVTVPLEVEPIICKAKSPDCGAVTIFLGTARNNFNGRKVTSLFYEAYLEMARKKFLEICKEIRSQWKSIVHIVVQHRLGEVSISENIVVVAISTPHRADGLVAMASLLSKLKETVPIWKRENYDDDVGVWKENLECIDTAHI